MSEKLVLNKPKTPGIREFEKVQLSFKSMVEFRNQQVEYLGTKSVVKFS